MKLANHVCLLTIFVLALPELTGCAIARAHKKSGSRVGEIVPLSARVAKKISEPIKLNQSPKKILEVGAGSGAMTPKIITKMTEQD
ncbi:MAG TPA: hypothetical protein VEL47_02020, partial [Myxococcota bacterium]|nr:hypothetical protein [Myxococcota bacterium]